MDQILPFGIKLTLYTHKGSLNGTTCSCNTIYMGCCGALAHAVIIIRRQELRTMLSVYN